MRGALRRIRVTTRRRAVLLAAALALGCGASLDAPKPPRAFQDLTRCEEPRPDVCTYEYDPVCGLIRTVVVCPDASCKDRIAWRNYSNACTACADREVESWKPGRCPEE
jgi:hypothetical protein